MPNLSRLANDFDISKRECKAIIETPKGRRNKFKYEAGSEIFKLSHVLPQGFSFPFDFGFIPSTLAEDGNALDVMVLMDEPAHVGCQLDIRLVGVIEAGQTENGEKSKNDRVIAVSVQSLEYGEVKNIAELKDAFVKQVKDFLALYNKDSNKKDTVTAVAGPERAIELLKRATKRFQESE